MSVKPTAAKDTNRLWTGPRKRAITVGETHAEHKRRKRGLRQPWETKPKS